MGKIITGANRPTMGDEPYRLGGVPSATALRPGMVVPKKSAKSDAPDDAGGATHRGQVSAQSALGAQYRITASRGPYSETNSAVQANGRIMPATTGSIRNFRSAQMYGAM